VPDTSVGPPGDADADADILIVISTAALASFLRTFRVTGTLTRRNGAGY
jgi:hypothetical protein